MLDTLEIHIPMQYQFCYQNGGKLWNIVGEVAHYGLKSYGAIIFDVETGVLKPVGEQKHAYESIPSSYGGMSFKFFSHNVANTLPYVSLKASAKFLQGHNLFGSDNVQKLACEMIAKLKEFYPVFYCFLDIAKARICRIDATYSARVANEDMVKKSLEFLRSVSNKQRIAYKYKNKKNGKDVTGVDNRSFYNTVYWGGRGSRHGNAVAYGKHEDVKEYYSKYVQKAEKGCVNSKQFLENIFYDELLDYSKGLIRFESRTKARILEKLGMPTNLWAFIRYQKKNPNCLYELWKFWFEPIFSAMQGEVMHLNDDERIKKLCYDKLFTVTKKGKISYTKAKNAYNFYMRLKQSGWKEVKADYNRRAFEINVKSLVDLGIPKALLQNIDKQEDNVVPVFKIIHMDFTNQHPNPNFDFAETDDEFASFYDFNKYINPPPTSPPPLRFVA